MEIIALIPNQYIANYTDQEWLQAAFKYGIVYSVSEWERIGSKLKGFYFQTLTVDNEFNVISNSAK